MKYTLTLIFLLGLLAGCKSKTEDNKEDANAITVPAVLSYSITNVYPHNTGSYTEGLEWHDSTLYESTGTKGQSKLARISLHTGMDLQKIDLSKEYFGEGITVLNGARAGMARVGIEPAGELIGLSVPQIRLIARRTSRSQQVAEQLWDTGIHDARILASLVADPGTITPETMTLWAQQADSWDICDACCCNLFDRTPHAWRLIRQWAPDDREFVRRAAFATVAAIAVHDKKAPDTVFLGALRLIEKFAFDDRNFARKGINWALRSIGKRNPTLRTAAIACAERVCAQNTKASRWIGSDVQR